MVAAEQDVFLELRVLDLFELKKHILADCFNCVLFLSWVAPLLCQENFTEGAFAEHGFLLEILKTRLLLITRSYHDRLT